MTGIAVIGCGQWGPNHIRNFHVQPGAKVICAVDADPARLDRVRSLFPGVECYQEFAKTLTDDRVNAIVVATPLSTHYPLVRDALNAGKHVLCEKPLTETTSQARELVDLAKKQNLILMTGHVFLFNPGIIKVKELVDKGDVGRFVRIATQHSISPPTTFRFLIGLWVRSPPKFPQLALLFCAPVWKMLCR